MRFSEGFVETRSKTSLLCSLPTGRKFREGENSHFARQPPGAKRVHGWAEGIRSELIVVSSKCDRVDSRLTDNH